MIIRLWRGWTSPDNADAYQHLLDATIVPGIIARAIPGLQGVDILRRYDLSETEVEFGTLMTFDDWTAVEAFAGPDQTASVVPPEAQRLLARFDSHSRHFEVVAHHPSDA